jgi:hypothetical protein
VIAGPRHGESGASLCDLHRRVVASTDRHYHHGMRPAIPLCVALALTASACFRPYAGTTVEPGVQPLPADEGDVRLVPLLDGPNPIRGGLRWVGAGRTRTVKSGSCDDDDALWYCARDRWLAGENRRRRIVSPTTDPDRLLVAADLGIAVRFGPKARTFVYLGDSAGLPAVDGCGTAHPRATCNDAILVADPEDRDPEDGVTASVAAQEGPYGRIQGFLPLVIPGVNGADPLPACPVAPRTDAAPCLGPFNVPTGAAAVRLRAALVPGAPAEAAGDVDAVLLIYGTATTRAERASWLAVSADGFRFARLLERPLSRDRFIQVAPVPLRAAEIASICAATPASPLCDRALDLRGDAVLLFGAGETYRAGRLYLGVLRLDDLAVRYYRLDPGSGREIWVEDERDATPIVEDDLPALERFGELSVARVDADACPAEARDRCADALVLLSNQNGLVRYRTARLAFPGARAGSIAGRGWSASRPTSGRGYGPYVIEAFTRVVAGTGGALELVLYHAISSWNGREIDAPDRAPYGVFTRRLELIDEPTCHAGDGDAPRCAEIPPPWPPEP